MRAWVSVVAAGAALVLVGCTSTAKTPHTGDTTLTHTQTLTRPPSAGPGPMRLALVNVPPRPPGTSLPKGEKEASCPYIKAGLNIQPEPTGNNFADIEGNRVQRVTVLTSLKPVGCRFYFQSDYHPLGDILPTTYASAVDAHNAMVLTAKAGTSERAVPSFVPGIDGISFRTKLNAPDAGKDWAFAFAKGKVMVVIRTDQSANTPANAEFLAQAVVGHF